MQQTGHLPGRRNPSSRAAAPRSVLAGLGVWSFRHRRRVLVAWVIVLLALLALGGAVGSQFKDNITGGNTESQQAASFLQAHFPSQAGDVVQVVFSSRQPLTTPSLESRITADLRAIADLRRVVSVHSPFTASDRNQLNANRRIAYARSSSTRPETTCPTRPSTP